MTVTEYMFRIAHISDVHLAPLPKPSWRELASKRITGYVNYRLNRARSLQPEILERLVAEIKVRKPDHIIVTGDLVNIALDAEIENAGGWLEALGPPSDVTVIPGNHDAYVPGALARALGRWRPYVCGDEAGEGGFPFLRQRGEVALIGCCSAAATAPFMATGPFDRAQAKRLEALLRQTGEQGLFRAVLIHHPPFAGVTKWHKRLTGAARFRDIIRNAGAELVLHGHTHVASLAEIAGPDQQSVPVVGVAAAGQAPGGHKAPAAFNWIEVAGGPKAWSCTLARVPFDADRSRALDGGASQIQLLLSK